MTWLPQQRNSVQPVANKIQLDHMDVAGGWMHINGKCAHTTNSVFISMTNKVKIGQLSCTGVSVKGSERLHVYKSFQMLSAF